jgi:hypothetical protein
MHVEGELEMEGQGHVRALWPFYSMVISYN